MVRAMLVAALFATAPFLALAGQPVRFGQAEITVPDGFSHALENGGKTLVLYPRQKALFQYRLTFHSLVEQLPQRPRIAEETVSSLAEKKRMQPYPVRGSSHMGFLDTGTRSTVNGEPLRTMQGAVSLGEGYATMTVAVPEKYANEPVVREFLGVGLESLLATLRYVGKQP
jgi:hypothetical protein